MADSEHEFLNTSFVDKRRTLTTPSTGLQLSSAASLVNVSVMRTSLAAANGTYYTTAVLNQMTRNDMIYALRTINEAAGI